MFDKILIANRGEIACRVERTCRRLGIRTVAVYSEPDSQAMHVKACDEAWPIGPAAARESYLNQARIIEVTRESGAQAIHPGYGFLSENAEFARACRDAGIVFIGPPPEAIEAMGSKSAAKAIMAEAGVPLVPGYHGEDQSLQHLAAVAEEIGYPVLIKASAGGGGKGMRRVDRPEELAEALKGAQREAAAAFGDARVLIEKYLLQPRHVEVQVFADCHGQVVHLFERDCSVQRRHQKVIEEAPAPGLDEVRRRHFGETAVAAARAIGYVGAGTVEFIMDGRGDFYFMEMNTRLQVEHPVTEMITGQDLVAWQLQVAAGQSLPCEQSRLSFNGHAFEARIYAEDADRGFLPATGAIRHLRTPEESPHVRIDTGVQEGDEISVHYDPMIAKLVVWDQDRETALNRLQTALSEFIVVGTTTNVNFLARLAAHPDFRAARIDTGFIETHRGALLPAPREISPALLAAATLHELLRVDRENLERARTSADPHSPWHGTSGWQLNGDSHRTLHFLDTVQDLDLKVIAHYRDDGFLIEWAGHRHRARGHLHADGRLRMQLDGVHLDAWVLRDGQRLTVAMSSETRELMLHDPLAAGMDDEVKEGSLVAPMPGMVVAVHVKVGDHVSEGDALMVLEAMKMEYVVSAFNDGVVDTIHFNEGDQVSEGAPLLAIRPGDAQ
ncbi:acetyl/propionyl/methylcrotonyl-CoA carboxylase subunit alpha [Ectothiorhodospira marina]|uniref:Biotin carboxylase n=1 Tax=Ectothiorhodospira marina TaxID=1396821 RepID=A0A1H7FQ69_9GAMM|nr:acetyl/propionyl/methylcrotonyl-CoA carboxylase subunit alpha [Ectothiorhodospira marina]SEK28071.1 3-methylcrotonyl-CoA carboxylase alpha subunit [Ectothiorhodospira marina]